MVGDPEADRGQDRGVLNRVARCKRNGRREPLSDVEEKVWNWEKDLDSGGVNPGGRMDWFVNKGKLW